MEIKKELLKIKEEIIDFKDSPLYKERKDNNFFPVIGEGNHFAKIMFVGEAPGRNEAKTGRPFCGQAGRVLNNLLISSGIKREDVYITNIVKDRPPNNRDPLPIEIKAYAPFLDRQIEIIKPKVIVSLGRHSMNYFFEKYKIEKESISVCRGKVFNLGEMDFIPLYHPAVAVYNVHKLDILKEDFKILKKYYEQ
ncbi:MAG: uracil-DNA glycosylase [Candidatus Pacebacteria bacterium]|nr:uracil-DNA glycosylase [Candidatus Paceibacterota bacterium]MDD3072326.1 uracil-DNA glycosylase [Candidatus Paceibacterota bacterium]MDD3728912.1 uracil-DNA glycosylase [Candidatus Paceibacterota bacterium]MDD4201485.1 uracil-DNA glycosylase [Candidatus Paceibacterota bacterium]MDD4467169.1 uracil-DNA glycosylase [Candidatus Paceibacterota bacterium]